jgi:hypothetical protein
MWQGLRREGSPLPILEALGHLCRGPERESVIQTLAAGAPTNRNRLGSRFGSRCGGDRPGTSAGRAALPSEPHYRRPIGAQCFRHSPRPQTVDCNLLAYIRSRLVPVLEAHPTAMKQTACFQVLFFDEDVVVPSLKRDLRALDYYRTSVTRTAKQGHSNRVLQSEG